MSSASSSFSQSSSSEVDGFFFRPGTSRTSKKRSSAFGSSSFFSVGKWTSTIACHRVLVGELDVVEEAAAQERVRQLLLVVGGDDDQRAVPRPAPSRASRRRRTPCGRVRAAGRSGNSMSALSISSISSTTALVGRERLPQHALDDVVVDVLDAFVAQLRVAQARHGVVLVQALLRLGGGLDVPLHQRHVQRARHFLGQHGLAGAGLALDQQRALQRDRGIDGELQVVGGDVRYRYLRSGASVRTWPWRARLE